MRAQEIMTRSVVTVHASTTIQQAAALMTGHGVTSLPVLDDDERVIGIVSEADLIRDRMPQDPRSHLRRDPQGQRDPARLVGEVMTENVVCMGKAADTADLATLMLDQNVRAIPIVEGARLVGIVSRRDLLRTLLRDDAATAAEITRRLADYAGEPAPWKVTVDEGIVTIDGRFEDEAQHTIVDVLARTVSGVVRVHTHRSLWT